MKAAVEFIGGPLDGDHCIMVLGEDAKATITARSSSGNYKYDLRPLGETWVLEYKGKAAEDADTNSEEW